MAKDTKQIERIAVDRIAHELQRKDILVAEPRFDQNGADLLGLVEVNDDAKFCRIQCKGRSVADGKHPEVTIPCKYVSNGLVVFVYVETGDDEEPRVYCFFGDEVKKWKKRENEYVLPLSKNPLGGLDEYRFNDRRAEQIKDIMRFISIKREFAIMSGSGSISAKGVLFGVGYAPPLKRKRKR
jgi:hypothetical protein